MAWSTVPPPLRQNQPSLLESKAAGKMPLVSFFGPVWRHGGKFQVLPVCVTGAIGCVLDWISPVTTRFQGEKQQNLSGSSLLNRATFFKGLYLMSPQNQLRSTLHTASSNIPPLSLYDQAREEETREDYFPLSFWIEGRTWVHVSSLH